MYVYVSVYVYVYVCIYAYMHACRYIAISMSTRVSMSMSTVLKVIAMCGYVCVYIQIYTHKHTHVQGGIKKCKPHPAFDFLANTLTLYTVKATKNAWLARPSATVGARQSSTVLLATCSSTRSLPSGFQLPSLEVQLCLGGCCASQEIVGRWPWDAPLCGAVRTKATL